MLQVQRASMARPSNGYYESASPQSQSRPRLPRPRSRDSVQSTWSSVSASSTYVHAPSICTIDTGLGSDQQHPDTPHDNRLTTLPENGHYYVVALYDFNSDDPAHIRFRENDIFEIVAMEPSGWWAAHINDNVGWIPMGFVRRIRPGLVDKLQKAPHDVRVQLYEEDRASYDESLGDISDVENEHNPEHDPTISLFEDPYDEVPVLTTTSNLRSPPLFPTDVTPSATAQFEINVPSDSLGASSNTWPSRPHPYATAIQTPRTPRTPVPPRGPAPAPIITTEVSPASQRINRRPSSGIPQRTLKVDTRVNKDKPTPPTPTPSTPSSATSSVQPPSATKPVSSPPRKAPGLPHTGPLLSSSTFPAPPGRRPYVPGSNSPVQTRNPSHSSTSGSPVVPLTTSPNGTDTISMSPRDNPLFTRGDKIRRITGEDEAQIFHNAKLAQALLPWYLKPEHTGDEIKLDHDGRVTAGTLEALVERLTVEPLLLEHEESYRHTFLTTFHSWTTADRVVELLIDRYEMDSPTDLAEDQFNEWKEKKLRPTQARVLHVFFVWVDKHGLMDDDPQVVRRLREFLGLISSPTPLAQVAKRVVLKIDEYRNSDIDIRPFTASMTPRRRTSKAKNDLLKMEPNEIARQLTLYEARLYLKIRPHECLTWASIQNGEGVRNLGLFVSTSDKLAAWVKMSVLNNDALGRRADTIDLWIKVAEKCRQFNNYSSMCAIVAALKSEVIAKLGLTWVHVHRTSHIEPLLKLFEPTSNFSTFRKLFTELSNASTPCLPYIGIYLSDMVKINETSPNTIQVTTTETDVLSRELRLINFMKYRKMADVVQNIVRHQPKVWEYKISETPEVMQYIAAQLNIAASKDEGGFRMRCHEVQHAELANADIRKGLEAAGF